MNALNSGGYGYPGTTSTVYTSDTGSGTPATNSTQLADTQTPAQPKTVDVAAAATNARLLAQKGVTDPAKDAQYLPLGVFTLAKHDETDTSVLLQMAVTKDGVVRGSYFDMATNKEQPVRGAVDKQTQLVAFTIGDDKSVYETGLTSLTSEGGDISKFAADDTLGRYTLERMEDPDKKDEAPKTDASTNS